MTEKPAGYCLSGKVGEMHFRNHQESSGETFRRTSVSSNFRGTLTLLIMVRADRALLANTRTPLALLWQISLKTIFIRYLIFFLSRFLN